MDSFVILKMINILIKRLLIRTCLTSKRYLTTDSSDVFKLQERGFFCDNLAEVE